MMKLTIEHNNKIYNFENGKLHRNYELDRNDTFTDGEEHELWWNLTCKTDWYLHDFIELRILEVDPNEL